ncbi:hypothetical protein [Sulfitobacter sp. 1A13730]|uniref:hypothetical protein n=1 Tax=Sulfitobacter sp. 1A13730 TaxID=3368569 RepID=UPI003745FA1A
MTTFVDELFSSGVTLVEVKCWKFGHTVVREPGQVAARISKHEFERRSVYKCGTGWPHVSRFFKEPSTTMK